MPAHPAPVAPSAVLDLIGPGTNLVVPLANGEPVAVLDAVEQEAERLSAVRVHQMHALHDRPYLDGRHGDRFRHVSYFLSAVTRPHFESGGIDFVPANFSEVPLLLRALPRVVVLAAASPPDRHGYFSLGTNADYVASLIGRAPLFLEANRQMPRTFGRSQVHVSQVAGWCESDHPLVATTPAAPDAVDGRIGELIAERIRDGATIQTGIGAIPNAVLALLRDHRDLGVHTELLSDGLMALIERGVVTGVRKQLNRTKAVATFALGTDDLYASLHENVAVELWPVRYVNDARIIGQQDDFVSINASIQVDLLGQCASESIGSHLYSGSGGQADFARGAMYSKGGQGFIVLRSQTHGGISRIVARLDPGAVVTTLKNTVDHVVTEHGVAELRGRTVAERCRALLRIAAPEHRDRLTAEARAIGYLRA